LESLDDPSKIGSAMAVALVTTFYGSILANLICNPIATNWLKRVRGNTGKKDDY